MTLPPSDTVVTYPAGATSGTATVQHVERAAERFAVLLDTTPCHPVDASWPDQPADRGTLTWNGGSGQILGCIVAATDGADLFLGPDIPVRKGTNGWCFVVAHLLDTAPPVGIVVTVEVDSDYRKAISLGHTGCHLASLALSRALADRWRKDVELDTLGSPNFDAAANQSSRILERGSHDTYRLGKSLRKRGFTTEDLATDLTDIEASLNDTLAAWIATNGLVRIDRDGDALTDRRFWVCELPDAEARIACGGTHASKLGELGSLRATLSLVDDAGTQVLVMDTAVS